MLIQTHDGGIHRILYRKNFTQAGLTYCRLAVVQTDMPDLFPQVVYGNGKVTAPYVLVPARRLLSPQPLSCLACIALAP